MCSWCSLLALDCRRISVRRWVRSDTCAASGWTARTARTAGGLCRPSGIGRSARPRRVAYRCPLEHVSFQYPGATSVVLDDVSVTLPSGAVVAIVGENGAGKTTLVKLLAKMYEPSSGSIFMDDTLLARVPAAAWRARLAGAFQDFFRFEFRAVHTVCLGDVPRLDSEPAVRSAD
jgi:ABC-type glutathione transport system ATPase component